MNKKINNIIGIILKIIFVVVIVGYACSITPKIFQNDTFYTIKIGELISNSVEKYSDLLPWNKGLDMKDHFSYHNLPYTYPHWLYDVSTFKIYSIGGFSAIYIATNVLSVILGLLIYFVNVKLNKSYSISFIITIGTLYCMKGFITARAQLVTFSLFILTIFFIELFLKNTKLRYAIALVIIPILIANLHCAVWPFYFILYLPYIVEYVCVELMTYDYVGFFKKIDLRLYKNKLTKLQYEEQKQAINKSRELYGKKMNQKLNNTNKLEMIKEKNVKWLILVFVICIFTGLCTPIKGVPYTYLVKTSQGNTTQSINEHLPLTLIKNTDMVIVLAIILGILIFSKSKIRLKDFFMLFGLIILSFYSQRQTSMLYLIGNFIAVRMIYDVIDNIRRIVDSKNMYEQELIFTKNITMSVMVIGIVTALIFNYKNKAGDPFVSEADYPVSATRYINEKLIPTVGINNLRLFNEYNYGSYLLFQDIPVFIDSRADLYTPEFNGSKDKNGKYVGNDIFSDFIGISNLSIEYEGKFEEYRITHVLVYADSKLSSLLEKDDNYSQIYSDEYFKIYERESFYE